MKIVFSTTKSLFLNGFLSTPTSQRVNNYAKNALKMFHSAGSIFLLFCLFSVNNALGQSSFSKNTSHAESVTPLSRAQAGAAAATAESISPSCTLTQSTSQSIPANSISCNSGGVHVDNSYWRAFNLTNALEVSAVQIGVESADAGGAATSQPLTVNIYNNTGGAFPMGTRSLVGTANYSVADQALSIISIPITASLPMNSQMVVEIFTPSGASAGNSFFIGSNSAGESGPSYLSAAGCSVPAPRPLADLGFNMHIVMNVVGCDVASCVADIANAGADQTAPGTTATLAANAPSTSTGVWTIISKTGATTPVITTPTSATSTVSNIAPNSSVTLRWTLTKTIGGCSSFDEVVITRTAVQLKVKAFLEAALTGITMASTVPVPAKSPYAATEFTTLAVLKAYNVVDWVKVELRSSATTVVATRSALLKPDGTITDIDGFSNVLFNVRPGNYFVSVQHRTHVGVMTAAAVNTTSLVDFRLPTTATYGVNTQKTMPGSVMAMRFIVQGSNANMNVQPIGTVAPTSKSLKAYPNPFVSDLTIEIDIEKNIVGDMNIELYDLAGKLMLTKKVVAEGSRVNVNLPTSDLMRGIYILRMQNGKDQWQQKITKQ